MKELNIQSKNQFENNLTKLIFVLNVHYVLNA